ncbi:MAG: aldehyde dehydrogenase family protein [Myxococcales bacterium]|nr:aldehyde dehydrogenase family protein [Myxococcales bacterium]
MSADAVSTHETPHAGLDAAVLAVKEKATEFARLPVADKARLAAECIPSVAAIAEEWAHAGCRAKGIDPASTTSGEEWLGGPSVTLRNLRLLVESLTAVAHSGRPPLGAGARTRSDGRVEVDVFPASGHDKALFAGFTARCLMDPGLDEAAVRAKQAAFYQKRDPQGGLSLILGAGNVSSIPPMDAFYKLFVDGNVCVLKMNPVNEYIGPILERALAPLIKRGYLKVVYGGGDAGKYLTEHAAVDDIHITGSDRTHDLIVWGTPGEERERRKRENDPLLKKTITSELGNVSPVAIVPAEYSDDELWFQARSVASMVVNNGSFNCNAAKVLIVSEKWPQRETFRKLVGKALGQAPVRKAYYPGARDRYAQLTDGRKVETFGSATADALAWTMISGVDSANLDEKLFTVEPFCGILSETSLPAGDPVEFLAAATTFMNDRMWGTLNAAIIIHPRHEKDATVGAALDRAIALLRYGTVAINHWPALGYGFVTTPWGGHQSATLGDIQSGLGWVHNTFMLDGIDKAIVRGPLKVAPKPAWFYDNRKVHLLGPKLCAFEAAPSWLKVPGMAITALGG